MLSVASYYDFRRREVPDSIWALFLVMNTIFLFGRLNNGVPIQQILYLIAPGVILGVVMGAARFWGGGDSKAMLCIATLSPFFSSSDRNLWPFHSNLALATFTNAMLGSLIYLPYILFKNLTWLRIHGSIFEHREQRSKQLMRFFFAIKVNASDVERHKHRYLPGDASSIRLNDDEGSELNGLIRHRDSTTWVTLAIPMVVLLTIGFLVAMLRGDLLSQSIVMLVRIMARGRLRTPFK